MKATETWASYSPGISLRKLRLGIHSSVPGTLEWKAAGLPDQAESVASRALNKG